MEEFGMGNRWEEAWAVRNWKLRGMLVAVDRDLDFWVRVLPGRGTARGPAEVGCPLWQGCCLAGVGISGEAL